MTIEIEDPAAWIQAAFVVFLAAIAWFQPLQRKRQLITSVLAAIAIGAATKRARIYAVIDAMQRLRKSPVPIREVIRVQL